MKEKAPKDKLTNKDIVAEIEERFKRHTGVLTEQMRKEVQTVAEGHSTIISKLNEHDKRFNKVESEIETVKMAIMDTNHTVKSIEKKLDDHETRLSKVEEKV